MSLRFYCAPLDGLTGHVFRNAHHALYGGVDKYFTPFLNATSEESLSGRELRDVLPENNRGVPVVPQLMARRAPAFLEAAQRLQALGYEEINLNLGCPSATVVTKGRGAGFLAFPDELEAFLDAIFRDCPLRVSIKTRIGMAHADEFPRLLSIYDRYPVTELIVHARTRSDFYGGLPRMDAFRVALATCRHPLVYNGDLFGRPEVAAFAAEFPTVDTLMLGRGLLCNPGLIEAIRQEASAAGGDIRQDTSAVACPIRQEASGAAPDIRQGAPPDAARLRQFLDLLLEGYRQLMGNDRNALFRMKELWTYLIHLFPDHERHAKHIRKAETMAAYVAAVDALFHDRAPMEQDGWGEKFRRKG